MNTFGELLTLQEAMDVLRCGKTKIYELEKEGRLELVKFDRATRVTSVSLQRLLSELKSRQRETKT
jgi:hypothetical protein